ncbi:hypothetical protein OUZ56_008370 [Daphnia magna]|uniref:Uncharacterized protein n=1 Tax=Daphnia magna TaxID=35525 RepID=A0ABR0ACS2_9CRUS|nr:hypothetical protein OUZ56_008370 [Daphnia magna]
MAKGEPLVRASASPLDNENSIGCNRCLSIPHTLAFCLAQQMLLALRIDEKIARLQIWKGKPITPRACDTYLALKLP